MPPQSSRSRFLRPLRTSSRSEIVCCTAAVLLGVGALGTAVLLGEAQRPVALICVFAVLLSALLGGHIAGWICLAITGVGFWILAPHISMLRSTGFQSILVLWSAYVALSVLLIEVIRRLQQERRRLLEQDQRLRLARRAARIWFWEWDLQRNLLRWSRETDSENGSSKYYEVPLEVYVKRRVHAEDRERILTALFEAAAGHQRFEIEFRVFEPDGVLHWLSAKGKIFDKDGTTIMLGMASDISERKRAEEALRASEKLATTGRIAATISHELRNPLDSVMQLLYLVKQSPKLGDTERQQLDVVDHELRRMAEVTQQTLALHRQSSSMVPLNLAKLIDGILLLYGKKIRSQNIQIEKQYEWQGEVTGFPAELRQVFTNLIVNAVESMPGGGKLRVHVRRHREPAGNRREGVLVALLDGGSGIPKAVREHIFEPFFTTKGEKGSGVGLWVSCGIVQRHHGTIRVHSDSRPGHSYSCFEVFLPDRQTQGLPEQNAVRKPSEANVPNDQPRAA